MITLSRSVIVLGGGGHASVLLEILASHNSRVIGIVDPHKKKGSLINGIPIISNNDDIVLKHSKEEIILVNAIGPKPKTSERKILSKRFLKLGYQFKTLIHPSACISDTAVIKNGCQVMAGAIIQANAIIGSLSVINSGSIIEHDSNVGEYNHIAPGAILCGGVKTESDVFIGCGSIILENLTLKENSILAAGVTLRKNLSDNEIFYGY